MANPWDDAPIVTPAGAASNPWDNAPIVQPATSPQGLGVTGKTIYGAAMGLADPIYGISRLALEGANKLSGGALDKQTAQYRNFLDNVENQYQQDTPGSIAAGTGRFVGNMVTPVKAGALESGASLAARMIRGSEAGAGISAILPIHNDNEGQGYWEELGKRIAAGASIGGAIPGAVGAMGRVVNNLTKAVEPIVAPGRSAADRVLTGLVKSSEEQSGAAQNTTSFATNPTVQDALSKLQNIKNYVPGSMPTTAQVIANPGMVMAEKTLRNNPETALDFIMRGNLNNAARIGQISSVAKTPQALAQALEERAAMTEPLYSAALKQSIPLDEAGQVLFNRPITQQALKRGTALSANLSNDLERPLLITPETQGIPRTPMEKVITPEISNGNGGVFPRMTQIETALPPVPGTPPVLTGEGLQYTKMGLDALKKEGQFTGISAAEQRAIDKTRDDLRSWYEKNSPEYAKANSEYAKASVPINTMQTAQSLQDELTNGRNFNTVGEIAPTLNTYRSKLAQALKESKYGIDPKAKDILQNIEKDLQRESISNGLRFSGSDTAFNLQAPNWLAKQLYGNDMSGNSPVARGIGAALGVLGGSAGGGVGGAAGAVGGQFAAKKIGQFAGKNVEQEFQKIMLDPEHARQVLLAAVLRESQQKGGASFNIANRGIVTGSQNIFDQR